MKRNAWFSDGMRKAYDERCVLASDHDALKGDPGVLRESPFAGQCPLLAYDDAKDELAFEWAHAAEGSSAAVDVAGDATAATRLRSVRELRAWRRALPGRSA